MRVTLTTAFLLTATLTPTVAWAQWTQYGGPGQEFKADCKGLAKEWPKDGPPKIWARQLGEGYSSILADGGRLYTMYREEGQERVISLDAGTGATLWEYGYDTAPVEQHVAQYGSGPNATPLLTGDRLYTIGIAGLMHCLEAKTGKVIWTRELWSVPRERHPHKFGYSSSPIEYKDMVITLAGEKDRSIIALSKDDGSVVYEAHDFANSYATPTIMRIHGEDQLVAFMATEVIGVDPNTGKLIWDYPIRNQWKHNITAPVLVDDDMLFISTLEAGARGLELVTSGSKTVVDEVWNSHKIRVLHTGWVRIGEYIYGSMGDIGSYFLAAVEGKTGKIAWRKRGFSHANVVYADGRLIILDDEGVLALATPSPDDLTIHSKVKMLEAPSRTPPTVVGRTLFIRDFKNIMALDLG